MPTIFSNNMVLQRGPYNARIYGWSTPNTPVVIALDQTKYQTYSDANGDFVYTLPPLPGSLQPHTLTVTDSASSITFSNVAYGDVYLCGGQSNMEFGVANAFNAAAEIADSINYPNIRLSAVGKTYSSTPLNDTTSRFPADQPSWLPASPDSVNGTCFTPQTDFFGYFSAVCYFAGKEMSRQLGNTVAIGLIEAVWSGSRIEPWMSPEASSKCPASTQPLTSYLVPQLSPFQPLPAFPPAPCVHGDIPSTPSVMYNAQIHPLLRFASIGMLWYQGESNAGNAAAYVCLFSAFISDLQLKFANNFAFVFVLLAGDSQGSVSTGWSDTRAAQLTALALPRTGVANAADLGDRHSPWGSVHVRNKSEIGRRVALNVLNIVYKLDVIATAPTLTEIVWPLTSSGAQTVIFRFDSAKANARGLAVVDTNACILCCANSSAVTLGLSNGSWVQSSVVAYPDAFLVTATVTSMSAVIGIRYDYIPYPECTITSAAQLPVLPFQIFK